MYLYIAVRFICFQTGKINPEDCSSVIDAAIQEGYRHFDCASIYENEKEIGDSIQRNIRQGNIQRKDVCMNICRFTNF